MRKPPVRHRVRDYTKKGKKVSSYTRGNGERINLKKPKLSYPKQTIGEWLNYMGKLEQKLSPKQMSYLVQDPYYQAVLSALDYQTEITDYRNKVSEDAIDFKNFPISDFKHQGYYGRGKYNYPVRIYPEEIEKLLKFWGRTENVILAERVIQKLNEEINHRTVYGARGELAPTDGHVLSWSNNAETWLVFGREYHQGEELTPQSYGMDANQVFAPYNYEVLKRIAHLLEPLPLFKGSFEAKSKGKIDWKEGTNFWKIAHGGKPDDE